MRFWFLLVAALFLAGCSSHRAPPPNPRLSDSITVIASLNRSAQQLARHTLSLRRHEPGRGGLLGIRADDLPR